MCTTCSSATITERYSPASTGERDGRTLNLQRVLVYHMQDGLLSECWIFDDDQQAVDEFWNDA